MPVFDKKHGKTSIVFIIDPDNIQLKKAKRNL